MTPVGNKPESTHDSGQKSKVSAPIPIRKQNPIVERAVSQMHEEDKAQFDNSLRSYTPNTAKRVQQTTTRRPSYSSVEFTRESHYNLDYPEGWDEIEKEQLDPKSRFFARARPRTLNLPRLLPYETEHPKDQAKFLSHIVSHLYIAIKSLDIQGSLSITAKDLASLKNVSGLSDVDLALETNLFEMNNANNEDISMDDESSNYFAVEEFAESDSEYEEEEEDEEGDEGDEGEGNESTVQHKKSPKSAAVVGVRIWTHELLVWLKMKYDMPLSLRMSLARAYYAICLSRGQHINLKIYVKAFELLTKDQELLKMHGLVLPWDGLCKELENQFPQIDSSHEQFEKKDHKHLIRLAEKASNFFSKESLPLIYARFGSKFSISNAALSLSSMSLLPLPFTEGGMNDTEDIRHYIASFFYIWSKLSKSSGIDSHLTSRLGTIAMASLLELSRNPNSSNYMNLGKFGVFSDEQMQFFINTLINSLSIMNEKYSSLKTKFFQGFASVIIFSINGERCLEPDGIIKYLETLLNAIESYVHPSNSGEWSRPISKLILSLVYQYHKRINLETEEHGSLKILPKDYKLTDNITTKFVEIFLPLIRTGVQSKKHNVTDDYLTCLHLLAYLRPLVVSEHILLDIYESLEGVISTHRVTVALRSVEELARYFASTPIIRIHLTRILLLALPGIDSNDLEKTIHTLNMFASVANFVPFHDLTDGNGDPNFAIQFTQDHLEYLQRKMYNNNDEDLQGFEVDDQLELDALKSSSAGFKIIMKTLSERLFILMENLPDPSKSTGIEKDLADALPKFLYVVFESLSDDIFSQFRDDFFKFVTDNTYHTIADVAAEICGGLIKHDPKSFKRFAGVLIDKIKEDIEENGAGASRTGVEIVPRDQPLFWNLVILNECIGNAGSYVVDCAKELTDLSFFLMDNVKGPTVFAGSYLLNQMLQSTTKIRLKENRLISPQYIEKYGIDEKCWGGFQFDKERFSKESLNFEWFIPTEREVKFAVECFRSHVSRSLENILKLMKRYSEVESGDANAALQLSDELRLYFLYLSYSISGISFLLDPSFDEDIPKLNHHETQSIQQRLILLNQIRGVKNSRSLGKDELRIENIHENLERIVEDIESDDLINYMLDFDKLAEYNIADDENDIKNKEVSSHHDISDSFSNVNHHLESLSKSESPAPSVDASGRGTPHIEGIDMSTMNPGITFRERKLYTSRYFFGDDMETRRSNELYLILHKTRNLIGKSLHIICKFLTNHFHDNTKLFKHFLYLMNMWFADVGRERLLDHSHAKINFGYVSSIQHINRVRKPYTRIALGGRIESYHLLRVALHATARTQTGLDKTLLEDVVKLSVSTYLAIAKPAQSTLVDAMKRLNGSYNVIIRSSFKYLAKALEENDYRKIESGLSIFSLKRIKNKIQNDYFNLQKYVELIHRCLLVDNFEVNELSQRLFKGVYNSITPPSSVCLIDHSEVDCIRPPDEYIDLEIRAVRLAKEKKRKFYFEKLRKLEDSVLLDEKTNSHWKITSLNLFLLIDLQLDLEMVVNHDVLQLLAKEASSDHPLISRLALKGITKMVNKLYLLQVLQYDLSNAYNLGFVPSDFKVVDTSPISGKSYFNVWTQEINNSNSSNYFIDHKANTGWLFWDKNMEVVTNEPCFKLDLKVHDANALKSFSNCVTKEWFQSIVKLWVTDNEANSAFQGTDVFVTATLVHLISNGYIEQFSFDDLLEIVSDTYVKDDKSSHIVVCELLAGILIGSKFINPSLTDKRDSFICLLLMEIFEHDLSPDNRGIWNIFSWWVPSHIDCRRFPKVTKVLTGFIVDPESDSALKEATRLSYIRSFVAAVTWTYPNPDATLKMCFDNINHRYQAIRDQIGSLIAILSFAYYTESVASGEEFAAICNTDSGNILYLASKKNTLLELIPELFSKIETWRLEVEHLTQQEILKSNYIYSATTVLTWLGQALNTSVSVLYQDDVDTHIVPFLLKLINMKDVCQLGNIDPITVFKKVSQIPYNPRTLERIVCMLERYSSESLTVVQSIIVGEFTETIYFKNLFCFSKSQRQRIISLTNKLLYHKNVEIREAASSTLSGLIHISPPNDIKEIVLEYSKAYAQDLDKIRRKHKKTGYKNIPTTDNITLHGATLGLGALVHAFPFLSPPPIWVPNVLTMLANKSSGLPGTVGKTAKDTLGKFKKNRQDTWHVDSKVFNESQMQDLEGVLWKSYFV